MVTRHGILVAALTFSSAAFSQTLSIGVIGGAAVTDGYRTETVPEEWGGDFIGTRIFSTSKDFLAGASIEMRFTPHWSLETDGMFREFHSSWATVESGGTLNSVSPFHTVTWEFPVLAKYRFRFASVSPFVEAGPAFRSAGNLNGTAPSHVGFTAGVGIEKKLGGLKIAPVVRYTRWASSAGPVWSIPTTVNQNQVELLVGFSPASESAGVPQLRGVSVGALVGTNLTGAYNEEASGYTNTRGVIAGVSLEVHLLRALSLEVDGLHRPVSATFPYVDEDGLAHSYDATVNTWTFPVLAKYRLPWSAHGWRPFVEAGPDFRLLGMLGNSAHHGVLAGAGVERKLRRFRIAPAIRYTRWGSDRFPDSGEPSRNQLELLAAATF
jgi:hypothetical protein